MGRVHFTKLHITATYRKVNNKYGRKRKGGGIWLMIRVSFESGRVIADGQESGK
jgi:hypothetical protein